MVPEKKHLDWVDGLKAFAIIGILLNHFVESFGSFPWFSSPSYTWPVAAERFSHIFPADGPLISRLVQFAGWLGDMGPGVFILLSGFTLTMSALSNHEKGINPKEFYLKRLIRIMPLYLVVHILIMVLTILFTFINNSEHLDISSSNVLFSMLGLRFTDELFFFINPSWWFMWLVIQLYLIFPVLFIYLSRSGIKTFLLTTFIFTILSRAAGLFNFTWSGNLMYWMMGMFFGTRLFEFTLGMVLARLYLEKQFDPFKFNISKIFMVSFSLYLLGFISSLFYYSTLISAPLITLGLSGIFLAFWKGIVTYFPSLKPSIRWIGIVSFPVFLLNQPFLVWVGPYFTGVTQLVVSLLVILMIFPVAWLIEWTINNGIRLLPIIRKKFLLTVIVFSLFLQIILNFLYFYFENSIFYYADFVISLVNIFFIPLYFLLGNKISNRAVQTILYIFIPVSFTFCFILTRNWFSIFWIVIILQYFIVLVISLFSKRQLIQVTLSSILVLSLLISFELFLKNNHPVEINRWGEFPALQKDSLTVYSLIPNKTTHLKYNNYDYYVKTNSLGFNGPEVELTSKDSVNEYRILIIGDAFTMPEGLEYENAYPELLEQSLSKMYPGKKIHVYNAGVTGYGPNEMYARLEKYIGIIKPDIYLNQVFINELIEVNLDSDARQKSLAFARSSLREELFENDQLPKQFTSNLHKLIKDNKYLSYLSGKSLSYLYSIKSDYYSPGNINRLEQYFSRVKDLCKKNRCELLVLYAPGQMEVSLPSDIDYYPYHLNLSDTTQFSLNLPGDTFKRICDSIRVPFVNPCNELKNNPQQPVYFRASWHWNPVGHKVISSILAREIPKYLGHK